MSDIQMNIQLNVQHNNVLNYIVNSMNQVVATMDELQESMGGPIDMGGIDGARGAISQTTAAAEELNAALAGISPSVTNTDAPLLLPAVIPAEPPQAQEPLRAPPAPEPVSEPVYWEAAGPEVFTGTGEDRFRQEVQSANSMLEQLCGTQNAIAKQAYKTMLFPPEAFQDMNALAVRINTVRDRIRQIENNPVNIGTDTANAELERLRIRLGQMVDEQGELNSAMQNMDVSAANDAYLRLSQTVGETERYIRDNVDEQGRFNQEIQAGAQQANGLANMIKSAAGKYINVENIGKVLDISDELTQATTRLDLMNDGLQSTPELVNMVYAAAKNTHAPFLETANAIAKMGSEAGGAFDSNAELIAFTDQVNKQLAIGGAGADEKDAVLQQVSQAMAAGTFGESELNSILSAAPGIAEAIEQSMGWAEGSLMSYAAEGAVTAEVVKNSLISMADETNAAYENIPVTFSQMMTDLKSGAVKAFQPVLQGINDVVNSEIFQSFVNGAIEALGILAGIATNVFDMIIGAGGFIADNWSIIEPVIFGVVAALLVYNATTGIAWLTTLQQTAAQIAGTIASGAQAVATFGATIAQQGLNAALAACPLSWIIIMIIALIAIIYAVCNAIAKTTGIANSEFGVITGGISVVLQFFKNLGLTVANIAFGIGGAIAALGSNIKTAFHNAICSVQSWFYSLLSTALFVVAGICKALNKLPFVEFDYSGISNAANEYAAKAEEAAGNKGEYKDISDAFNEGMTTFDTFQDGWAGDAFAAGAAWGDGVADKISNFNLSDIFGNGGISDSEQNPLKNVASQFANVIGDPGTNDNFSSIAGDMSDNLGSIAGDTGAIKDSMDITQEDLKYLRDIAEQEAINRFTTAEVHVDMSGMRNTVNSGDDIDGFMAKLTDSVYEAVGNMTEGVHA